jgi:deoxyribonuclease-4
MSFIKENNIKIGGHIGFSKTIFPTLQDGIDNKMNTIQFFLGNPKSFTRQRLSEKDIINTYEKSIEKDVCIFSHYPYTSSLCGSVNSLAWNGDSEQDEKTTKILKELEFEVNVLSKLSQTNGVVIHPGSNKNREEGLNSIAKSINKINFNKGSKLLLENSAGEGTKLCRDFKEIESVLESIDIKKIDNVGVCVDTAHIWGSGIYDLSKEDGVKKMFDDFDNYIGLEKFSLLHLNDSEVPFGSKKDRHECLGYGHIWKEDNKSLKYLLKKCGENDIPIILETPNVINDLKNIDLLKF